MRRWMLKHGRFLIQAAFNDAGRDFLMSLRRTCLFFKYGRITDVLQLRPNDLCTGIVVDTYTGELLGPPVADTSLRTFWVSTQTLDEDTEEFDAYIYSKKLALAPCIKFKEVSRFNASSIPSNSMRLWVYRLAEYADDFRTRLVLIRTAAPTKLINDWTEFYSVPALGS